MKPLHGLTLGLLILFLACQTSTFQVGDNKFSSSSDTLHIQTEKVKGGGLFPLGAGTIEFNDTAEAIYPLKFPTNIQDIQILQLAPDFSNAELGLIDIMRGKQNDQEVIVVDQNNNRNFTDDPIRPFQIVENGDSITLIPCEYLISNGNETIIDSTWIRLYSKYGMTWQGRAEHLMANFQIDGNQFTVGMIDPRTAEFTYSHDPEIALLAMNSNQKDTLLPKEMLKKGEFLKLGTDYYKFDKVGELGRSFTLIKEKDFASKVGIQVGMLAPEFDYVSIEGDTSSSENLHDRPIILANTCGCGGDKASPAAYYNIKDIYGDKLYALRLDSAIEPEIEGVHIDTDDAFNKDIYSKYRQQYCSRVAYLIGENNRILDKFDVVSWESYLSAHLSN